MHLSPELVDTVADYLAIFVLFFVPALLIYLFWMVHILPEKIAERARASAGRRDQDAVPAVAGLRRPAVADRVAVGVFEAGALQDGLRHRPRRASIGARRPRSRSAASRAARGRWRSRRRDRPRAPINVVSRASTDMEVLLLAHLRRSSSG